MRTRHLVLSGIAATICAAGFAVVAAQDRPSPPRQISYASRLLVEQIRPGEQHVTMVRTLIGHPVDIGDKSYAAAMVEFNPIIIIARILRKEPEFMNFANPRVLFTIVPLTRATWIGSRLTTRIERVIDTVDELALMEGDRLAFVVEHDGSASIDGTLVKTETDSIWPVEEGKRYLVTGTLKDNSSRFAPSGMWLEPAEGAPLRGPGRRRQAADRSSYETVRTFEQEGEVPLNVYELAEQLQGEVSKKRERGVSR